MIIPHTSLSQSALRAVIEEFVSREGTDYGCEVSLDAKVQSVMRQLEQGRVCVVFDTQSESCDIVSVGSARYKLLINSSGSVD
jgi:uncharacterized protein YheU (UPF0270 family)